VRRARPGASRPRATAPSDAGAATPATAIRGRGARRAVQMASGTGARRGVVAGAVHVEED